MTPCCSLCTPKQLECKGTACTTSRSLGMVARARRFGTGNAFQVTVPVSSCSSIIESAPELELERQRRRAPYATAPEQGRCQDLFPQYSTGTGTRRVPAVPVTHLSCLRGPRAGPLSRTHFSHPLEVCQRRGQALDLNFRQA